MSGEHFRCAYVSHGRQCWRRGVVANAGPSLALFCREHAAQVAATMAGGESTGVTRRRCAYVAAGLRCQNAGTVSRGIGAGAAFVCAAHHHCRTEREAAAIVARSRDANENAGPVEGRR